MTADFLLAGLHHLLVFTLAGLLAAEMALLRPGLTASQLALLGRIDAAYGGVAVAVVAVGVLRLVFGLKGWAFYAGSPLFWAKMAAFGTVGLASIVPTVRILQWRRAGALPADEDVRRLRLWLRVEVAGLAAIVVLAAGMARGIGS